MNATYGMKLGSALDRKTLDPARAYTALSRYGLSERFRTRLMEDLRVAESESADPSGFREDVRWPIVEALLAEVPSHRVTLENGLAFDVRFDSRIERALLLSRDEHPDHVWEPQTTRLLVALSRGASNVIVGGAYIGDQVLPIARALSASGVVHAFEVMDSKYAQLVHHVEINGAGRNVRPVKLALWDRTGEDLRVVGEPALANCTAGTEGPEEAQGVRSVAIDDYVGTEGLKRVELVMLDLEGGEAKALAGARRLLAATPDESPTLVFEVHREYLDWSGGLDRTPLVEFIAGLGYSVYAIRDYHDNVALPKGFPIEIIPADAVYLEGPPHGFNMLATKDPTLVQRLSLRVVRGVSPKLLPRKDPRLHAPLCTDQALE